MNTQQPPDAARAPLHHAGGGDAYSRLSRLHEEFTKVLGVARVFVRHQGTEHFLSGRPEDTLRHDPRHADPGASRYDWEDRGDGVLYGRLTSDATAR